jgi:transcriptional regulator with XRE-family HTH domain
MTSEVIDTKHAPRTMAGMPSLAQSPAACGSELGALLRHWRGLRGRSQLDVATDTGISQRHISFVESGRSVPSRPTLMALARALDVPLRDRNALLLAAGYAPAYSEAPLDAAELRGVMRAVERMLRQHEPFPALLLDRHWNVLMTNAAAPRFFGHFVDLAPFPAPRNLLRLVFDPQALRPAIADWQRTAQALLQRVHLESAGRTLDDGGRALVASLLAFPDVPKEWPPAPARDSGPSLPVIPIGFVHENRVLNYFSMVATVGTPHAVTVQELRLECMFPADEATEELHLRLFGAR